MLSFVLAALSTSPCSQFVDERVVIASDCGFNATDSTEFLQAAINSGASTVVIDKKDTPWYLLPITLVSDQTLLFKDGVVVRAKRGAFHGTADSLITGDSLRNVSLLGEGNATVAMWRDDYANASMYTHSEARMAFLG